MITLQDAFSWLNRFNISHISILARPHSERWQDPSMGEAAFELSKQQVLQSLTDLDPFERPEVLLLAAVSEFLRGRLDDGRSLAREALKLYPDVPSNRHRRACVLWMSGIMEYQAAENMTAYSCWQASRLAFEELAAEQVACRRPDQARWYYDRLREMRLEMAVTAEEAYTWLNVFPPDPIRGLGLRSPKGFSRIDSSASKQASAQFAPGEKPEQAAYIVIDRVNDRVRQHHYASACKVMDRLIFLADRSQDHADKPEIWLECGLAAHQMDMHAEAVELLRHAAALYGQRSHRQAVAFWMIGVVLWHTEGRRHELIPYWEQAIGIFQDLEMRSDHRNLQERREWYRRLLEVLPQALEHRVSDI